MKSGSLVTGFEETGRFMKVGEVVKPFQAIRSDPKQQQKETMDWITRLFT